MLASELTDRVLREEDSSDDPSTLQGELRDDFRCSAELPVNPWRLRTLFLLLQHALAHAVLRYARQSGLRCR